MSQAGPLRVRQESRPSPAAGESEGPHRSPACQLPPGQLMAVESRPVPFTHPSSRLQRSPLFYPGKSWWIGTEPWDRIHSDGALQQDSTQRAARWRLTFHSAREGSLPAVPGLGEGQRGPQLARPSPSSLLSPRCSTVSTLSVQSNRASRRRKAARSRGREMAVRPLSSWTSMPCGPQAPARCPPAPAPAPAHAHPTGSTNKGGSGRVCP